MAINKSLVDAPMEIAQFLTDVVTAAGLLSHGHTDKKLATRISDQADELRKHIHLLAASPIEQPAPLTTQTGQHADWRGDFERQASAGDFDLSREEFGGEYCHPDSAAAFRWYYTGRLDEACSGAPASQSAAAPIDSRFTHPGCDVCTCPPGVCQAEPAPSPADERAALLAWAVERWDAEVKNRPLINAHRRSLDDTWRQVIRHCGGDDVSLLGPRHGDLLAANPIKTTSRDPSFIDSDLNFEPDAQHAVADMANIGYALMQTIYQMVPGYSWCECPTEIVSDLINERDEARASSASETQAGVKRMPSGYAYRYPHMGGTVTRFNSGGEVNGSRPIEAVPYWFDVAPEWVSVSDRLPARDTWVLAHNGKWTGVAAHFPDQEKRERWQDEHREFVELLGPAVTHWMPMPTAPVGGSDADA